MKKIYLMLACITLSAAVCCAATVTVNVVNYVFVPDNFTINSGDTVIWTWGEGNHTTTSTAIPSGATPWNAPINQANLSYMYIPSISGNYDYQCNFHLSMGQIGHFTVLEVSGIEEAESGIYFEIRTNPTSGQFLHVDLTTTRGGMMNLSLHDITGREVKPLASGNQSPGEHHYEYDIMNLSKGVYLVKLTLDEMEMIRRVVIN